MIFTSISLIILALTGGMFLLAKTNKDNLSLFFRIISYFIIIGSFLSLVCLTIHCSMRFYGRESLYNEIRMHEKFMDNHARFYRYMNDDDDRHDWRWSNYDGDNWDHKRKWFDG